MSTNLFDKPPILPPSPAPIDGRSFQPIQAKVPAGFTIPAVGANVVITITPLSIATNVAFQVGDIVIAAQVEPNQGSSKLAWLQVASVATNTITATVLDRSGSASTGAIFAAGQTEITGQTRLPSVSGANRCTISIANPKAVIDAAFNSTDSRNAVAVELYGGFVLAYYQVKFTGDIDANNRMGIALSDRGSVELQSAAEINQFRLIGNTNMDFAPHMEVLYYA